jgi:hypothetical protein
MQTKDLDRLTDDLTRIEGLRSVSVDPLDE